MAAIDWRKRKRTAATDPGAQHIHCRAELNSHADTCSFGDNALVVSQTGDTVAVSGFTGEAGVLTEVPVATIAIAFDCPNSGHTFVLYFHQALHIRGMKTHLLSPFQMRHNNVVINEVPLQHLPKEDRQPDSHSIVVDEEESHPKLVIQLDLDGVMSGALFRVPTWEEVNDHSQHNIFHVDMTSTLPWEPHSRGYNYQEGKLRSEVMLGADLYQPKSRQLYPLQVRGQDADVDMDEGQEFSLPFDDDDSSSVASSVASKEEQLIAHRLPQGSHQVAAIGKESTCSGDHESGDHESSKQQPRQPSRSIASISQLQQTQIDYHGPLDVDSFAEPLLLDAEALLSELGVTENYMESMAHNLAANTTIKKRKGYVSAEKLAQNWGIGKETAKRTLEVTTQLAVRDFRHTSGARRLKPNAWMLRYPRRDCNVYTDTMFSKVKSLRGNTCMQIFCTDFHYIRAFPMKSKKEAHYTLEDFFRLVGIPAALIPDNAKELTLGNFLKTAKRYGCPITPVESYTPDANSAEDGIKELKRMFERKMLEKAAPGEVWDWCVEWCALVRCFTALNSHILQGRTPHAMMTGKHLIFHSLRSLDSMIGFGISHQQRKVYRGRDWAGIWAQPWTMVMPCVDLSLERMEELLTGHPSSHSQMKSSALILSRNFRPSSQQNWKRHSSPGTRSSRKEKSHKLNL